jgi:hypothetical protein
MAKNKFVNNLGPIQSNRLNNLFYGEDGLTGTGALALLEKWGVGPDTWMRQSHQKIPYSAAGNVATAAINMAGTSGIDWLLERGFTPEFDWFRIAFSSRREDRDQVLNALVGAELDPHGTDENNNTLWHIVASSQEFDPVAVHWLRSNKVSWSASNAQGETPLCLLMSAIAHKAGVSAFFEAPIFGSDVRSIGSEVKQGLASFFGGSGQGLVNEINNDRAERSKELKVLEDLAVDMVQAGESLQHKNTAGVSAAAHYFPEQSRVTQVLARNAPAGVDPDAYAMQTMMGLGGWPKPSFNDPDMFGAEQQAFLHRLESVSGEMLLVSPASTTPTPPRRRGP